MAGEQNSWRKIVIVAAITSVISVATSATATYMFAIRAELRAERERERLVEIDRAVREATVTHKLEEIQKGVSNLDKDIDAVRQEVKDASESATKANDDTNIRITLLGERVKSLEAQMAMLLRQGRDGGGS